MFSRRKVIAITLLIGIVVLGIVLFNLIGSQNMPKGILDMEGDTGDFVAGVIDDPVHDPSIFKADDTYYVVSTGIARDPNNPGGIYIRSSDQSIEGPWESIGEIPVPEWVKEYNIGHLWAPHVVENDGTYYIYYAASIFGTNNSAIGVASTTTPGNVDSWEDHGPIISTKPGEQDYNAIDPMVFEDDGKWWITFGSHFSGIKLQELNNMVEPVGEVHTIASRAWTTQHNPIEAPTIFKREGYYYLLTSWDSCCQGIDSTYKVAVGRSESLTGPYVDKNGVDLNEGGGEIILSDWSNHIGPGGQDIIKEKDQFYMIYHYYDKDANGIIRMQIRSMEWEDGWPYFTE